MPPERRSGQSVHEIREAVDRFLAGCRQPALLEPGEDLMPLSADNCVVAFSESRVTLQAWDRSRNLTRRVVTVDESIPGRLELTVEKFAKRLGQMYLLDLARRSGEEMSRRSGRLVFRERFRLFLRRQFAEWTLKELSAEANLQFSLSPAFPRAFLRHGNRGWAAISSPPDADSSAVLSFGLIWLSYLREREARVAVEGLAIYVPAGREQTAALRLLCLNPALAQFALFTYSEEDYIRAVDPRDHGNLDTVIDTCRIPPALPEAWQSLTDLPGVETIPRHDGRTSLRVRGVEFAEYDKDRLSFGLDTRRPAGEQHAAEIHRLAAELDRARNPGAPDPEHALYRGWPEAWLESQARAQIDLLDATLRREPVYGQVPAFAGGERGVLDLLAIDADGRLAILELKASADLHLPMQALDYWIRVKWHLDRGEFSSRGYFPGIEVRSDPPRLLLVSPSLEFHPVTETLLGYFSPLVDVERIGLALEWRKRLRVMFRLRGAERPR